MARTMHKEGGMGETGRNRTNIVAVLETIRFRKRDKGLRMCATRIPELGGESVSVLAVNAKQRRQMGYVNGKGNRYRYVGNSL